MYTDRQRQIDGDLHGGINATDLPCNVSGGENKTIAGSDGNWENCLDQRFTSQLSGKKVCPDKHRQM